MSHPDLQLLEQAAIIQPTVTAKSGPSLDPPAPTTALHNSGPFLRMPREIRDNIYRFLPFNQDNLRYVYNYRFYTPILYINRQVHDEASHVFYMENLFIRIDTVAPGLTFQSKALGGYKDDYEGRIWLPILSSGLKAQTCTRHVMEIHVVSRPHTCGHYRIQQFIIACDDLPILCRALLLMDRHCPTHTEPLLGPELRIVIGDEVGTAEGNSVLSNRFTDEKAIKYLTAATKNTVARRECRTKNAEMAIERNASTSKDRNSSGSTTVDQVAEANSQLSEPLNLTSTQIRRLLEPFRILYSIRSAYIDAPISARYRQEIRTSLCRAWPSIHESFQPLTSAYEEAIDLFDAGEFALAIQKMRGTLDILDDFWKQFRDEILALVPIAGSTFRDVCAKIDYTLSEKLARAHSKFDTDVKHVCIAQALARRLIEVISCSEVGYWGRHEYAMIYYLNVEVWEALDQLGEHNGRPRSEALRDVIGMLKEALLYEPGNAILELQLERRLKEQKTAATMEELMEMEKKEGELQSTKRAE